MRTPRSGRPAMLLTDLKSSSCRAILLAILLCLGIAGRAWAQDEALALSIAKSFGYAWRGEMQGIFTLTASGPPDVTHVTFLLDSRPLVEVAAPPFTTRFTTDNYPLGAHTLGASGLTADGRQLHAEAVRVTFVGPERAWQMVLSIGGPIIALGVGFVLVTTVVSLVGERRRKATPGAPRRYGIVGGAVCPRCGRPFSLHAFSLNFITRRYDRCPHCGRWSMVRTASPAELRAAEAAETEATASVAESNAAQSKDDLRRALEDSRYMDE